MTNYMPQHPPSYSGVSRIFDKGIRYVVPKYQRAYAWKEDNINDFISDFNSAYQARTLASPTAHGHFFGGIVTVSQGSSSTRIQQYEIIDGQQRIITFSIFLRSILTQYVNLKAEANNTENNEIAKMCEVREASYRQEYVEFEEIVNGVPIMIPCLTLSRRDNEFFAQLMGGNDPQPSWISHELLLDAKNRIESYISGLIVTDENLDDRYARLALVDEVLREDLWILHLKNDNKRNAYRLFQVINDRGVALAEADLIRSKIIELLDGDPALQDEAEKLLDVVVSHKDVLKHLFWVYQAALGKKPKGSMVFDDYMSNYFCCNISSDIELTPNARRNLLIRVNELSANIEIIKSLLRGDWPFPTNQRVTRWEEDRLSVLLNTLKNENSIPLLLSAIKLPPAVFSKIVQCLERFFFRYKTMCRGHDQKIGNIYNQYAKEVYDDPNSFNMDRFKASLTTLINDHASDEKFSTEIREMEYRHKGNNKPIKHLLLMIEQHITWFNRGAQGEPVCFEKTILDRGAAMSIEHIYPKSIQPEHDTFSEELEPRKNNIDNLTLLTPTDNNIVGTDPFSAKKEVLSNSHSRLTQEVSQYEDWDITTLDIRKERLISISLALFVP